MSAFAVSLLGYRGLLAAATLAIPVHAVSIQDEVRNDNQARCVYHGTQETSALGA